MKKVLITGIDGFTGKYLEKKLLQEGFEVYGTVLENSKEQNHFLCDITNFNDINDIIKKIKPNFIIHLAAISFVGESDIELFYKVNVVGTQNLLDAIIKNRLNPKKIILASSATVYGKQKNNVLDESMCPNPINHYGISKYAMEQIAKLYFEKLNIIITKPFNYTGIGQAEYFLIPKIVKHYKEKKEYIELGNLDVAREFNDVDYIIEIYYRLLMSNIKSEIVNLSSNRPIKLLDIIDIMNSIAGYQIKVKVNPKFVRENEIKSLSGSTKKLFGLIEKVKQKDIRKLLEKIYFS